VVLSYIYALLQECDDPRLLGGEYQSLDKQIRRVISCLCYGRTAYPHEIPQAATSKGSYEFRAGESTAAATTTTSVAAPSAARDPLLRLRFLADGAPLTAPSSERKLDTWQERAGERLEDARMLAEHCTSSLPSHESIAASREDSPLDQQSDNTSSGLGIDDAKEYRPDDNIFSRSTDQEEQQKQCNISESLGEVWLSKVISYHEAASLQLFKGYRVIAVFFVMLCRGQ